MRARCVINLLSLGELLMTRLPLFALSGFVARGERLAAMWLEACFVVGGGCFCPCNTDGRRCHGLTVILMSAAKAVLWGTFVWWRLSHRLIQLLWTVLLEFDDPLFSLA